VLVHIFHEGEVEKSEGRQQVLHIVTGKHAGVKAVGAAVAAKTEDKKEFVEGSHLDRLHDFETERAAKVECSPAKVHRPSARWSVCLCVFRPAFPKALIRLTADGRCDWWGQLISNEKVYLKSVSEGKTKF
jgi:hypothetical protein